MKLGVGKIIIAGLALGAGQEIGRTLFMTGVRVLNKKFRQDVRTEYNRRLKVVVSE